MKNNKFVYFSALFKVLLSNTGASLLSLSLVLVSVSQLIFSGSTFVSPGKSWYPKSCCTLYCQLVFKLQKQTKLCMYFANFSTLKYLMNKQDGINEAFPIHTCLICEVKKCKQGEQDVRIEAAHL
jgi:hypothetical protein